MDNSNKPAFPVSVDLANASLSQMAAKMLGNHGLTKRELFAMAAMAGLLANPDLNRDGNHIEPGAIAERSVRYADHLLKKLRFTKIKDDNEPIN